MTSGVRFRFRLSWLWGVDRCMRRKGRKRGSLHRPNFWKHRKVTNAFRFEIILYLLLLLFQLSVETNEKNSTRYKDSSHTDWLTPSARVKCAAATRWTALGGNAPRIRSTALRAPTSRTRVTTTASTTPAGLWSSTAASLTSTGSTAATTTGPEMFDYILERFKQLKSWKLITNISSSHFQKYFSAWIEICKHPKVKNILRYSFQLSWIAFA